MPSITAQRRDCGPQISVRTSRRALQGPVCPKLGSSDLRLDVADGFGWMLRTSIRRRGISGSSTLTARDGFTVGPQLPAALQVRSPRVHCRQVALLIFSNARPRALFSAAPQRFLHQSAKAGQQLSGGHDCALTSAHQRTVKSPARLKTAFSHDQPSVSPADCSCLLA